MNSSSPTIDKRIFPPCAGPIILARDPHPTLDDDNFNNYPSRTQGRQRQNTPRSQDNRQDNRINYRQDYQRDNHDNYRRDNRPDNQHHDRHDYESPQQRQGSHNFDNQPNRPANSVSDRRPNRSSIYSVLLPTLMLFALSTPAWTAQPFGPFDLPELQTCGSHSQPFFVPMPASQSCDVPPTTAVLRANVSIYVPDITKSSFPMYKCVLVERGGYFHRSIFPLTGKQVKVTRYLPVNRTLCEEMAIRKTLRGEALVSAGADLHYSNRTIYPEFKLYAPFVYDLQYFVYSGTASSLDGTAMLSSLGPLSACNIAHAFCTTPTASFFWTVPDFTRQCLHKFVGTFAALISRAYAVIDELQVVLPLPKPLLTSSEYCVPDARRLDHNILVQLIGFVDDPNSTGHSFLLDHELTNYPVPVVRRHRRFVQLGIQIPIRNTDILHEWSQFMSDKTASDLNPGYNRSTSANLSTPHEYFAKAVLPVRSDFPLDDPVQVQEEVVLFRQLGYLLHLQYGTMALEDVPQPYRTWLSHAARIAYLEDQLHEQQVRFPNRLETPTPPNSLSTAHELPTPVPRYDPTELGNRIPRHNRPAPFDKTQDRAALDIYDNAVAETADIPSSQTDSNSQHFRNRRWSFTDIENWFRNVGSKKTHTFQPKVPRGEELPDVPSPDPSMNDPTCWDAETSGIEPTSPGHTRGTDRDADLKRIEEWLDLREKELRSEVRYEKSNPLLARDQDDDIPQIDWNDFLVWINEYRRRDAAGKQKARRDLSVQLHNSEQPVESSGDLSSSGEVLEIEVPDWNAQHHPFPRLQDNILEGEEQFMEIRDRHQRHAMPTATKSPPPSTPTSTPLPRFTDGVEADLKMKLNYLAETMRAANLRAYNQLWAQICSSHNRHAETARALVLLDATMGARLWLNRSDIAAATAGDMLQIFACSPTPISKAIWTHQIAGTCYDYLPVIVNGSDRFWFRRTATSDLVQSSPECDCASRPPPTYHNASGWFSYMAENQTVWVESSPVPVFASYDFETPKQPVLFTAGRLMDSDTVFLGLSIEAISDHGRRLQQLEHQVGLQDKKDYTTATETTFEDISNVAQDTWTVVSTWVADTWTSLKNAVLHYLGTIALTLFVVGALIGFCLCGLGKPAGVIAAAIKFLPCLSRLIVAKKKPTSLIAAAQKPMLNDYEDTAR
ncbi:hypothetical protein L596_026606 [Steinernema carpocapsae]|uniref:Uncharacterized protein n=1 Tax=Steinernema carpocapsae TaxID=34508 RepID=A0A4U5M206_STECR|nr:hypothetical protein L596_026606 [Steinernema carpocapsae]